MVKTLFIRNLTEVTQKALEWGSNHFGINESTKIGTKMINDYPKLYERSQQQAEKIAELEKQLSQIQHTHELLQQAKENFATAIDYPQNF